jgi:hypothetical protein
MSSIKVIVLLATISILSLVSIGCSDSDSPVAVPAAPVVDTMPPSIPTGLQAQFEDGQIYVSWAANNVDADLAGFLVSREHDGVTSILVATPTLVQGIEDNPLEGLSTYRISSVDDNGNESAFASINFTYEQPQRTPRQPEIQY